MSLEIVGEITVLGTIAVGRAIRDLRRLQKLYGKGRWRKMPMESGGENSSGNATWTMPMTDSGGPNHRFAVCVRNEGYEASLERNKIYVVLADEHAEREGDLRVVDESGEDYLYPADWFVALEVPKAVQESLLKAS